MVLYKERSKNKQTNKQTDKNILVGKGEEKTIKNFVNMCLCVVLGEFSKIR